MKDKVCQYSGLALSVMGLLFLLTAGIESWFGFTIPQDWLIRIDIIVSAIFLGFYIAGGGRS